MKHIPLIGLGLVAIAIGAVVLYLYQTNAPNGKDKVAGRHDTSTVTTTASAVQLTDSDTPIAITHVTVSPDGIAVFSGDASPGLPLAIVTADTEKNSHTVATTMADANGQWVAVADAPLVGDAYLLALVSETETGDLIIGDMAVLITLADNRRDAPLVALVPYSEAATGEVRILQSPFARGAVSNTAPQANTPHITIRSISVVDGDQLRIEGGVFAAGEVTVQATPNTDGFAIVQDQQVTSELAASIAKGRVDASRSQVNSYHAITPIPMRISRRFDVAASLRGEDGTVLAQDRVSLTYDKLTAVATGGELIVVEKGDMLWRIAYRSYGQGLRFVDIYQANINDIGDPDLIFPNQVFVVPAD